MKKIILLLFIVTIIAGCIFAWMVFGSATTFDAKSKYIYAYDSLPPKQQIEQQLQDSNYIRNLWLFNILADRMNVWNRLKPGRFEIEKGESLIDLARRLRNNVQAPARLVINKLRTSNDLAKLVGKNFSTDSAQALQFLTSNDSLQPLGVDTNTLFTLIIPDTYIINWNSSVKKILQRLDKERDKFWHEDRRLAKADSLGLSPKQVYTLASIVEEETNKNDEKGEIASVYINRYKKGMPLGADPTIKFALKDFALKRILYGHLQVASPYNTYRNAGLPPGPICTPSEKTIDAVLNAPSTDYLFFVAKSDFSGYHQFSSNYAQHQQYAKQYQQALNERVAAKQKAQ
ncbi:endolytic transglycosylase MltG [Ilyomonas limi]|uniref:Endolytic murein transglycosylase n=1 Tax=Ilyomonas limi TaxID=2575867 RepID=A0A4U3L9W8_9BACT|nr:endolytic transglycosylase MltG [Ilyomonas limi]TKK70776.1 endolytic transglycosylase MltG [Ilyomonas limi]